MFQHLLKGGTHMLGTTAITNSPHPLRGGVLVSKLELNLNGMGRSIYEPRLQIILKSHDLYTSHASRSS